MLRYTFIEHPLIHISQHLKDYIPGAMEGYVVLCDTQKELRLISISGNEIESQDLRNKVHLVQKFRKEKTAHSWMRKEMFYFLNESQDKRKKKKVQQLALMDEGDNNYLCLRFISPYDRLFDVLIIKITHAGMFGMSSGSELNTQQKAIIGKLTHNFLSTRIKEEYNNLETHGLVLNSLNTQKTSLEQIKNENEVLKTNYKKSLSHFIQSVLLQLKKENGISISLSDEARTLLMEKITDLEVIEKTIRSATHLAINLSINAASTLLIEAEHLVIEERKVKAPSTFKNDKYTNIIEMLDRYELAATKAHNREWKINGNTVAEICEITPSAITFNLKKHKKAINIVADRHEDRWPLLRTYFKPFKNVLEESEGGMSSLLSA